MGRHGDDGFRDWAHERRSALRHTAFLLTGDWHLADDLVQETLVRMYTAWPRVGESGVLTNYARRVLVNLALDHRRRPSRRERPTDELPEGGSVTSVLPDPNRDVLIDVLRRLPRGQRAVLVLRFWEDLSVEQTAEIVGTSAGNVKSQTSRGLAALRAALESAGVPDLITFQEQG